MKVIALVLSALSWLSLLSPNAAHAAAPDLATVLANDDAVSRRRALVPYIMSLLPQQVPGALKAAVAGHGVGRQEAIDALSGRWVEIDAPAALAFSRQTGDREARYSIWSAYYGPWTEHDLDRLESPSSQIRGQERAIAIWSIAHEIGPRQPGRALELLESIHATKMTGSDYFHFWHWAKIDLPAATQALLQKAKTAGRFYPCQTAVSAMIDRLFEDDPRAAASWATQLPLGKVRDEAFERLISEWKKTDPELLTRWLKSSPESDITRNALLNLPRETKKTPPRPVKAAPEFAAKAEQLDRILKESNFWLELEALVPFVDGLTPAEFSQALDHLRNVPEDNRKIVSDLLVSRWFEIDPTGVIAAIPVANTIHDSEFADHFLADVYGAWAQRDPETAFATATLGQGSAGNYEVLRTIFTELARQDPAKAYTAFKKLNDANSHVLVIPVFTEWAARDQSGATAALANEVHKEGAIEGMIIGLMRQGPATAIEWAEHLPDQAMRDRARQDIALRWPDDPKAAATWLEQSPDFEGKDRAFDDVAVFRVIWDTSEALGRALELPDGKEKESLLFWGLGQLTYDDAEAAQRFARQLPDPQIRKQKLATVLGFWGEYNPSAAAEFLSSIKNEATPDDVATVAQDLSNSDPSVAVRWLETFPASLDRTPAIIKIAENWHRSDSAGATAWVSQLSKGVLYDAGVRGICAALAEDLPQALKWARSISDPKIRHDAVYQASEASIASSHRYIGDFPEIRNEINGAPELTDAEKNHATGATPSA